MCDDRNVSISAIGPQHTLKWLLFLGFLTVLGFELRASSLLGLGTLPLEPRPPQPFLASVIFQVWSSNFFRGPALDSDPPNYIQPPTKLGLQVYTTMFSVLVEIGSY
jgi:hypothetical protein